MFTKSFRVFSWHLCFYTLLSLCPVIVQIVSCTEENGVKWNVDNQLNENIPFFITDNSDETDTTSTTPVSTTSEIISSTPSPDPGYYKWPSLYDMSLGKILTLLIVSFSIPVAFMLLLFWRLHKEKKYLRSRTGALVYRETIIVPSYSMTNASNNVDDYTNSNVVQMHSTLYDTPPNYDDVLQSPAQGTTNESAENQSGTGVEVNKSKMEELPPPPYSTVYI